MKRSRRKQQWRTPPWTPFQQAVLDPDPERHEEMCRESETDFVMMNSRYQVNVRFLYNPEHPGDRKKAMIHLSWKRLDKQAVHDWREIQRMKNEICGREREAFELYPPESKLVDTSNQYHLWVLPEGETFGVGFQQRLVMAGNCYGSVQRDFEDPELQEEGRATTAALMAGKLGAVQQALFDKQRERHAAGKEKR